MHAACATTQHVHDPTTLLSHGTWEPCIQELPILPHDRAVQACSECAMLQVACRRECEAGLDYVVPSSL
eukprot:3775026-Pleurochrysis_carterae.AAC.1